MFHSLFRSAIAVAATIASCALAQAADITLIEGENQLPMYQAVTATFTPERDCKVLIEAANYYLVSYNGQDYDFQYLPTNYPAYVCEIDNVGAGSTITLSSSLVMSSLVRITTFETGTIMPIEVKGVYPEVGTSDFWKYAGELSVSFNRQVSLSKAELVVGNDRFNAEIIHVSSAVSINVGTTLNQLLTDGTLQPGGRFRVSLSGLCDAADPNNLYNGTGVLNLSFVAPHPQYGFVGASVAGTPLSTSGLNAYTFLSYYSPEGEDGLFVFEFETDVKSVNGALLQMGNRDLDAQGKYYEGELPCSIDGNKVLVDARGVLRSLNVLFPAVVEEELEDGTEPIEGLGSYDTEHLTLRLTNVVDVNGNNFRSVQAGNLGSYSFYMNYRELMETINFDGDNRMAGEEVVPGETISLWLGSENVTFDAIAVTYIAQLEDETYEPRTLLLQEYTVEPDAYQGVIITFVLPEMPDLAVGQTVRVALHNASSPDGMPHDLSIEYKAGDPSLGIETIHPDYSSRSCYSLQGMRTQLTAGVPCISGGKVILIRK